MAQSMVKGQVVDEETRCVHWKGPTDIIALKFRCCPDCYYPCYECHDAVRTHDTVRYDLHRDPSVKCVLCGVCKQEMTFQQYAKGVRCVNCQSEFNPGCKTHYQHYFENIPM